MKRKDVEYIGIFTEYPLGGRLFREIDNQHITLAFRPDADKFKELLNYVGTRQTLEIKGYGNDGKNEGLLVELKSPIPYYGAEQQHITLSVSQYGKSDNTAFLEFDKPIPLEYGLSVGDIIYGHAAAFTKDGPVFMPTMFDEYQQCTPRELPNINEIKQDLIKTASCGYRGRLCPEEINLGTAHFRVDGGDWQALNPDDWSQVQEFLNDPDCTIDMTMQCFDSRVSSSFFPVTMYGVERAELLEGNAIIVSHGAVLSNIDFVGKVMSLDRDTQSFDGPDFNDGPVR
jgi:hypothetical protein